MVKKREFKIYLWLLFVCLLVIILLTIACCNQGIENTSALIEQKLESYRNNPFQNKYDSESVCNKVQAEIRCTPYPDSYVEQITYENSWGAQRNENAKYASHLHEGCDLIYEKNKRGEVPVRSMTNGVIEQMGWLYLGGWRIGIRSASGAYYYYAHLDSYAPGIKIGKTVTAGEFLGFMGDSGYGIKGTKGKFIVHLHIGIYVNNIPLKEIGVSSFWNKAFFFYDFGKEKTMNDNILRQEISINPFYFLKKLNN